MMTMYDHHIIGWVIFLSLVVVFIIGLLVISRAALGRGGREGNGKRAIDFLDERYARGDISREEYLRAKNDILGKG
ncbi:MAG: SHOCT domain-containing protein [Deltaproteobacteria bacterium]|nr:SHOCT domain-containing protein [Deltaproteobacteria bacterium]